MAEELSGKYFRAYSKNSKKNTYCPLYRNPPDTLLWADRFIQVPVSQDTIGVYYAPAIKASHASAPDGGANISKTIDPAFKREFESNRTTDIFGQQTITLTNYTYVDINVSITVKMSYGAKSDGWCWNRTSLSIDGTNYDEWYTTKSDSGTATHSWTKNKILLGPGVHTIGIYTITKASDGDPASFECNNVQWNIVNYRTKAKLTDMHCKIDGTEYILVEGPGY